MTSQVSNLVIYLCNCILTADFYCSTSKTKSVRYKIRKQKLPVIDKIYINSQLLHVWVKNEHTRHKKNSYISVTAFLWCHQESNRGHKDFQSFALPTELWHHRVCNALFSIASAKVDIFFYPPNYIQKKLKFSAKNALILRKTRGNAINFRAKPSAFQ